MRNADQYGGAADAAGPPEPSSGPPPETSTPDLAEAVRAAQQGDEEAFRLLFRAVQPPLLRYLRVLVGGDGSDAEDVASETWLQIARDLHTFRGDADGFRGWAATIGRHRAMDHLRAKRRRPTTDLPVEELLDLPARDDTEGAVLTAAGTREALALIAGLPRDQAEAVLLRVVMQLDAESAARVLGKRAGTVRMAAHRGLRRLAKLLESRGAVPGQRAAAEPSGTAAEPSRQSTGPSRKSSAENSSEGVTPPGAPTLKDMR
ncbi:RNA polymerase sigma factor [Kitasatospora sp. NPDC052896]|uniref:RNA polymerase sigma factor n=1 Tax=Kitasatospora sp. NPDC052896 TaxID=3364061 RepID=UPI0037C658A7